MLTVADLMTANPDVVTPEDSLRDAVVLMNHADHRQLPVVEEDKLVGIVSNRDIRLAVNSPLVPEESLGRIAILEQYSVADCMTKQPKCIQVDAPIQEAAEILALHKVGALPVLKGDELVGIISVTDLLIHLARQPVV